MEARYLYKGKVSHGTYTPLPAGKDGLQQFLQGSLSGPWIGVNKPLGWVVRRHLNIMKHLCVEVEEFV